MADLLDKTQDFSKPASGWVDEFGQQPLTYFNVSEEILRKKYGISESKSDKLDRREREEFLTFTYDLGLYISKYLRHSTTLIEFDISSCRAGDTVLKELGSCLGQNQALKKLKATTLGATGGQFLRFAEAIEKTNYGLIECDIGQENSNIIDKSRDNENYNLGFVNSLIGGDYSEDKKIKETIDRVRNAVATNFHVGQAIEGQINSVTLPQRWEEKTLNRILVQLADIEELTLDGFNNKQLVHDLPKEIRRLSKLTKLNLRSCKAFNNLHADISMLQSLTELHIILTAADNRDSLYELTLPPEITALRNLQDLEIVHARLMGFETVYDRGTTLRRLLPCVPDEIGALTSLTRLSLKNCQCEKVTPKIGELTNLVLLSLDDNKITSLPAEVGRLVSLNVLTCNNNLLQELPETMGLLRELTDFEAQNNRLLRIPLSMVYPPMNHLKHFKVGGNMSLEKVPQSMLKPNAKENVKEFLEKIYKGSRVVNRSKLMIVGDGGVGKSTLVKALELTCGDKKKQGVVTNTQTLGKNIGTDGIDISKIEIKAKVTVTDEQIASATPDEQAISFQVWDFAGQEVYYATHSIFLNSRSLFIVCCSLQQIISKNDQERMQQIARLEYWLQSIEVRAPDAPVIVVCSKGDLVPKKDHAAALESIKQRLSRFRRIQHLLISSQFPDAKDKWKASVKEVIKAIKQVCLDKKYKATLGIEETRPVSYLSLEESCKAIGAMSTVPTMSFADWKKVAVSADLITDDEVINATKFLHNLGTLIYFDEDSSGLKDTVILDTQWLIGVFKTIFTLKPNMVRAGVLQHNDLGNLWTKAGYPSEIHPYLIAVLERFELLHRLKGSAISNIEITADLLKNPGKKNLHLAVQRTIFVNEGFSMVPALLPETPPSRTDIDKYWPEIEDSAVQLGRNYEFAFLPNGFFPKLMVRLLHGHWQAKVFWAHGIVLYKDQAGLFLTFDPVKYTIQAKLRGPSGSSHMGPIIDDIEQLIRDWLSSVKVTITIPCNHCINDRRPVNNFEFQHLQNLVSRGEMFVTCGPEQVRIDTLAPDLTLGSSSFGFAASKVDWKDVKCEEELGRGGYAVVYRGIWHGQQLAVKQLIVEEFGTKDKEASFNQVFTEFRREVWLMSGIKSDNLVQLKGVCTKPLAMLLEYMDAGNLYDYVHKHRATMTWDEIESLALDIASGMKFLHSTTPPIIHRDLKSPNILLKRETNRKYPVAKIADFGLSRGLVWSSSLHGKVVDNPVWLAPEILEAKSYSEKVDVYAFGVILWEMSTGQDFFHEVKFMSELEDKICKGERPVIPKDAPAYYTSLIQACWDNDSARRPSFDQCVMILRGKKNINFQPTPSRCYITMRFESITEEEVESFVGAKPNSKTGTPSTSPTVAKKDSAMNMAEKIVVKQQVTQRVDTLGLSSSWEDKKASLGSPTSPNTPPANPWTSVRRADSRAKPSDLINNTNVVNNTNVPTETGPEEPKTRSPRNMNENVIQNYIDKDSPISSPRSSPRPIISPRLRSPEPSPRPSPLTRSFPATPGSANVSSLTEPSSTNRPPSIEQPPTPTSGAVVPRRTITIGDARTRASSANAVLVTDPTAVNYSPPAKSPAVPKRVVLSPGMPRTNSTPIKQGSPPEGDATAQTHSPSPSFRGRGVMIVTRKVSQDLTPDQAAVSPPHAGGESPKALRPFKMLPSPPKTPPNAHSKSVPSLYIPPFNAPKNPGSGSNPPKRPPKPTA